MPECPRCKCPRHGLHKMKDGSEFCDTCLTFQEEYCACCGRNEQAHFGTPLSKTLRVLCPRCGKRPYLSKCFRKLIGKVMVATCPNYECHGEKVYITQGK